MKFFKYLPDLRLVKRVAYITLGFIFVLFISGLIFALVYQKQILNWFITEANKQIVTPVKVRDIQLNTWRFFPEMAISLKDVVILDSHEVSADTLAEAREIYLLFNPFHIIRGQYQINDLLIRNARVQLKIDEKGERNFDIIKKDVGSPSENQLLFELKSIQLSNVFVIYHDIKNQYKVEIYSEQLKAGMRQKGALSDISVKGDLLSYAIGIEENQYFKNKKLDVLADLTWDNASNLLTLKKGDLVIDGGQFAIDGNIVISEKTIYNLSFEGVNTSISSISSLLPDSYAAYLKPYRSRGRVYFNGLLKGESSATVNPLVELNFGMEDVRIYHPRYRKSIENAHFKGFFSNGSRKNFSTCELKIEDFSCLLDNRPISASFNLRDFNRYLADIRIKGQIELPALLELFPGSAIARGMGRIEADINWSGALGNLSGSQLSQAYRASGELILHNVSFALKGERLPFNAFSGSFIFRNKDLAISNFRGYVGKSDFLINGFLRDFSSALHTERRKVMLEADLKSYRLDFDELLRSNFASIDTSAATGGDYYFSINPDLDIDFNCEINALNFQRFKASNLSGRMRLQHQLARFERVRFGAMGGRLSMSGTVNDKKPGKVEVSLLSDLSGINIDSIFHVFHNFRQDFIMDRHLRGQLHANVSAFMVLDQNLVLNSQSLESDIKARVLNGQLLGFEPMQKLSRFVEEESLANLKFSEMQNNIRIQNRTVYLPEMDIFSNVSHIRIKGTHTFDQEIDYRLSVPLRKFLRLRKSEASEIDTETGGTRLFLKITGTTDEYTIAYDAAAVKDKIRNDIRKEGQDLKSTFQEKRWEKPKTIELEEEEYFEF
ncbi:MAG: AsmA family protein [Cyclobacteriaceae bacterium]|nr:AsmA family protein [Cyclobacteriaceae bacterium]